MFGRRTKRVFHIVSLALAAALVLFHLRLLWTRLADGSVFDPVVAARWLMGLALAGLLVGLKRRNVSVLRGRPALVAWLLVMLLHAVALVPGVEASPEAERTAELLLVLPAGLAAAAVIAAGAVVSTAARWASGLVRSGQAVMQPAGSGSAVLLGALAPRAPPVRRRFGT